MRGLVYAEPGARPAIEDVPDALGHLGRGGEIRAVAVP
jgi:hypothetical protein